MFLNNYSVRVPEGQEDNSGYVVMQHNSQYRIVLKNSNRTRCNASVEIDGKPQGTWRIDSQNSITLERPAHDDGLFTFYKAGSGQGNQIGLDSDDPNLGLIKVTFTPEKIRLRQEIEPVYRSYGSRQEIEFKTYGMPDQQSKSLSAGGTGLSGNSNQIFGRADWMDLDHSSATTIHLRLVAKNVDEPRPLTSYSNPVPPSIRN